MPPSELVTWTSASGVDTSAGYLQKTAGNGWGNAGAISTQELDSSAQIQGVSFKCGGSATTDMERSAAMIGLGHANANSDFGDIEFALYCSESGIQVLARPPAAANLAAPLASWRKLGCSVVPLARAANAEQQPPNVLSVLFRACAGLRVHVYETENRRDRGQRTEG
jgi:hypothetical protein